jgi:hypothetical protein
MNQRTAKKQSSRQRLAVARIALREVQDHYELIKAQAEQRIIEAAGGTKNLGANAEDRTRALTLALAQDSDHAAALTLLRQAQAEVDRLQAEVDDAIDQRRKLDRASRDRASAAIETLALLPTERVPLALVADTTRLAA